MNKNRNFARVKDGALLYAPNPLLIGDTQYITNDPALYLRAGWKQVVKIPEPDPVEGYMWILSWEETDTEVVQTWTQMEAPEPQPSEFETALQEVIEE